MKQLLKVSFYLKKNEAKNGICPVMGRIRVEKTLVQFSTRCSIPESLWDTHSGRALGKSKLATELNQTLDKINVSIHTHHKEILERNGSATAEQVKNVFQGIISEEETLIQIYTRHNEEFKKRVGINREESTYKLYKTSLKHVTTFLREKFNLSDIPFTALDLSFIEKYDFYLRVEQKKMSNTILGITQP